MKAYTVRIHYSGYLTRSVLAEDEYEAIESARKMGLDEATQSEILSSLEPWEDADEAETDDEKEEEEE